MAEIVHELSWSASRGRSFAECRRRYYWDYYGSWRGWERESAPERRRAYVLRKLTRMPMLAGDCLHRALAWWFERRARGRAPRPEEVEARALASLRAGYRESRDGLWRERPARRTHLAEHHYREPAIDEATGAAGEYGRRYVERIREGVRHFFGHPRLARVRDSDPGSWLACEELGTIELFRTKVYAAPDFALREPEEGNDAGRVRIYDWKTGAPRPEDDFQLLLYAVYAAQRWRADPERVTLVAAYLPTGEIRELQPTADDVEEVLGEVHASIDAMRALHFDADRAAGDPEAFPMVPDEARAAYLCGTCGYRELCGR